MEIIIDCYGEFQMKQKFGLVWFLGDLYNRNKIVSTEFYFVT